MRNSRLLFPVIIAAVALALTGCSPSAPKTTPTPAPTVVVSKDLADQAPSTAPVFVYDTDKDKKVTVAANTVVVLKTKDAEAGLKAGWTGSSNNEKVAVFTQGKTGDNGKYVILPAVKPVAPGTAVVTLKNSKSGQKLTVTLKVVPAKK